jgi:hypothetical protein
MTVTKYFAAIILGLVTACIASTQHAAWAIDYQVESFQITNKIYFPWAIVIWYNENKHIEEAAIIFKTSLFYGLLTYLFFIIPTTFIFFKSKSKTHE